MTTQPFRSLILDQVGSTNTEAFERAQAGETGPLWIMARRQTQGRGRSGRQWQSEHGNLYASLLLRLACEQGVVHQLSLVTGVAAIDAIRAAAGGNLPGLRLKWPNDVLIGGKKCAGILAESQLSSQREEIIAVIGVGINLAWHPPDLGRPVTQLAACGLSIEPEPMLGFLDGAMQLWLDAWKCGAGFALVRSAWLERAGPIGEDVTVHTGQERIEGTFLDLDDAGALVLRDRHGLLRVLSFGDVTLAGPGS